MLVYNVLIALFLVYLFTVGHLGGVLLWPAVVLHAVVALLLIWSWRIERPGKATCVSNEAMRYRIGKPHGLRFLGLVLALALFGAAMAQGTAPATKGADAPGVTGMISLDVLKGTWVRPDGGYTIVIKSIGPNGQLEATYFNPNPLPFAKAQASLEGETLRASFELQAGGYNGSTYELSYDRASDRLKGTLLPGRSEAEVRYLLCA